MENSAIETAAAELGAADFSADLASLSHAVDYLAKRITDKRNTLPIVGCILIEADPRGTITLTATDLDLMASLTLAASVDSPGAMAIEAQLLQTTLAKARKGSADDVRFTESDGRATVKLGRNRFSMPLADVGDFPRMPFAEPLSRFALPASQFLADLAALAPCISQDDPLRRFMRGARLAVETLAGQARLAMVATDGRRLAIASRALPSGAESLAESILPAKAVQALVHAGKFGGIEGVQVEAGAKMRFTLGCITITTKLIDPAYLDWQRPFTSALAPVAAAPALFPELLPGAPVKAIEAIAKGAPGPVAWERTQNGFVGTVAGDEGLLFAAYEDLSGEPVKGYHFERTGEADAQAYLESLAASRGLPSIAEIEARVAAVNAEYGEPDNAAYNHTRPYGGAVSNGAKLITRGNRVIGLTISGQDNRSSWSEKVQCWETLSERTVWHEGGTEPIEGSYSILMPAEGPQLAWTAPHSIEGPDGNTYLVADNGSAIHMNKDQVRALIGESCFETMAITMPDGSSAFILQWLWDQGDTRFLTVRANGRTYPGAPYVTRAEIEAGPVVQDAAEIEAQSPSVEIPAEPLPYTIRPARYAKGKMSIHTTPRDGYKSRACRLVSGALGLRWSGRSGYVASPAQAERFERLYAAGFDGSYMTSDVDHPEFGLRGLTWREADRLAKEWLVNGQPAPESAPEPAALAETPAEPVTALCEAEAGNEPVSNPYMLAEPVNEAPESEQVEPDPIAALVARIEALERQAAIPPAVESDSANFEAQIIPQNIPATPIEAKRTPAHERAIRRAWAMRIKAREAVQIQERNTSGALAYAKRCEDSMRETERHLEREEAAFRTERSKRRRSTRLARYRGQQMATLAGMVNAADLRIAADTAAHPLSGEVERLKRLAIQNAGHMDALLSRAMRAETVLRLHSLEPLPPVVLPPERVAA